MLAVRTLGLGFLALATQCTAPDPPGAGTGGGTGGGTGRGTGGGQSADPSKGPPPEQGQMQDMLSQMQSRFTDAKDTPREQAFRNSTARFRATVNRTVGGPNGIRITESIETTGLSKEEKEDVFRSMTLIAGQEARIDCAEFGERGCPLCSGRDGCQMGAGSIMRMDRGIARLPASANASAMRIQVEKNATLRVEGGKRDLIGEINGRLEVRAGSEVNLAEVTGDAKVAIERGARVTFRGAGDSDLRMVNDGEMSLGGIMRFTNEVRSTGKLNITQGARVEFAGADRTRIAGNGLESYGDIGVGPAGLSVRGEMKSFGRLNVSAGATVKFEPKDDAFMVFPGHLDNITDIEAFKDDFANDMAEELSIPKYRVSVVSVDAVDSDRRRLSAGSSKISVTFYLEKDNSTGLTDKAKETELEGKMDALSAMSLAGKTFAGKEPDQYERQKKEFESVIGGEGLSLKNGAKLEIGKGNVTFEGLLQGSGRVDVAKGGRLKFDSLGENKVGDGLKTEPGSTIELDQGKLSVEGKLESSGKLDIKQGAELSLKVIPGQDSTIEGEGLELAGNLVVAGNTSARRRMPAGADRPTLNIKGEKGVDAKAGSDVKIEQGAKLYIETNKTTTNRFRGPVTVKEGSELKVAKGKLETDGRLEVKPGAELRIAVSDGEGSKIKGDGLKLEGLLVVTRDAASTGRPELKIEGGAGVDAKAGSEVKIEEGSKLSIATETGVKSKFRGPVTLEAGTEMVITDSKVDFSGNFTSSSSEFFSSAASELGFGGKTNVNTLTSEGALRMQADKADTSGRRQLQTAEAVTGDVIIGAEGLNSTGHVIVPAGSSLTFNSNQPSTIAGIGLDNHGTMTVKQGAITVAAGGIRSNSATSSIDVEGGALNFDSTDPSLIGGLGLSVDSTASVSISSGPVAFNAAPTGTVSVASAATVYLSTSSGASCDDFNGAQSCNVADVVTIDSSGAVAATNATCANLDAIGGCVGQAQSTCTQLDGCCEWASGCVDVNIVRNTKTAGSVGAPGTPMALLCLAASIVLAKLS